MKNLNLPEALGVQKKEIPTIQQQIAPWREIFIALPGIEFSTYEPIRTEKDRGELAQFFDDAAGEYASKNIIFGARIVFWMGLGIDSWYEVVLLFKLDYSFEVTVDGDNNSGSEYYSKLEEKINTIIESHDETWKGAYEIAIELSKLENPTLPKFIPPSIPSNIESLHDQIKFWYNVFGYLRHAYFTTYDELCIGEVKDTTSDSIYYEHSTKYGELGYIFGIETLFHKDTQDEFYYVYIHYKKDGTVEIEDFMKESCEYYITLQKKIKQIFESHKHSWNDGYKIIIEILKLHS